MDFKKIFKKDLLISFFSKQKDHNQLNNISNDDFSCSKYETVFRNYDIRGISDIEITEELAFLIGKAFGSFMHENSMMNIVVGYDVRYSSIKLKNALLKGLLESGIKVTTTEMCPTQIVYFTMYNKKLDAGIMVTASHNPPEYNGFKFIVRNKQFLSSDILNLKDRIEQKNFIEGHGREIIFPTLIDDYIKKMQAEFKFHWQMKVVWDIGNGSTSNIIKQLTHKLPGTHILVSANIDPNFPYRGPDPMTEKAIALLSNAVTSNQCDVGFAFDADGDRLVVVDSKGRLIYSDQLIVAFAADILPKIPKGTVIVDVKSSANTMLKIAELGGIPIMEKVGHSTMKAKMIETNAILGAEISGHIFFADKWYGFDDAIYAALRVLELLEKNKNTLLDIQKAFVTPDYIIKCKKLQNNQIVEFIKQKLQNNNQDIITIDGVRVTKKNGWWVLRCSNTLDAITVRMEADSQENLLALKAEVKNYIIDACSDLTLPW